MCDFPKIWISQERAGIELFWERSAYSITAKWKVILLRHSKIILDGLSESLYNFLQGVGFKDDVWNCFMRDAELWQRAQWNRPKQCLQQCTENGWPTPLPECGWCMMQKIKNGLLETWKGSGTSKYGFQKIFRS